MIMKPTLTANDELLLPNGKLYLIYHSDWATANIVTSTNNLFLSRWVSPTNSKCLLIQNNVRH